MQRVKITRKAVKQRLLGQCLQRDNFIRLPLGWIKAGFGALVPAKTSLTTDEYAKPV